MLLCKVGWWHIVRRGSWRAVPTRGRLCSKTAVLPTPREIPVNVLQGDTPGKG